MLLILQPIIEIIRQFKIWTRQMKIYRALLGPFELKREPGLARLARSIILPNGARHD